MKINDALPDLFYGKWLYCDNTPSNADLFNEWVDTLNGLKV